MKLLLTREHPGLWMLEGRAPHTPPPPPCTPESLKMLFDLTVVSYIMLGTSKQECSSLAFQSLRVEFTCFFCVCVDVSPGTFFAGFLPQATDMQIEVRSITDSWLCGFLSVSASRPVSAGSRSPCDPQRTYPWKGYMDLILSLSPYNILPLLNAVSFTLYI